MAHDVTRNLRLAQVFPAKLHRSKDRALGAVGAKAGGADRHNLDHVRNRRAILIGAAHKHGQHVGRRKLIDRRTAVPAYSPPTTNAPLPCSLTDAPAR